MGLPLVDKRLLDAKSALGETSAAVDVAGCAALAFYVIGNGAVSGGVVTIEEAHDVNYTGTWALLAAGGAVTVVGNGIATVKVFSTAKAVRARITTAISGGTASVHVVGG